MSINVLINVFTQMIESLQQYRFQFFFDHHQCYYMGRGVTLIAMAIVMIIAVAIASDILNYAYVDHMECKVSKEYCSNSTCKLSFISRRVKQLSWTCNMTKSVDIVNVIVILYYRYRVGYKKFLIEVNIDYCAYHHDNQLESAILDLVKGVFKNYTKNIWTPCPFLQGTNLILHDLPLTSALVQNLFVPAGEYKLTVETLVGHKGQASLASLSKSAIFITVPAGRSMEDDKMG